MSGPPHPGLVAKKISVLGKLRRHMQTFWVKAHPDVHAEGQTQLLRLQAARHGAAGDMQKPTLRERYEKQKARVLTFLGRGPKVQEAAQGGGGSATTAHQGAAEGTRGAASPAAHHASELAKARQAADHKAAAELVARQESAAKVRAQESEKAHAAAKKAAQESAQQAKEKEVKEAPVAKERTEKEAQEALQGFFKERGLHIPADMADHLMKLFKKPDGTAINEHDFKAMFKHPGKKMMPIMEETSEKETWGTRKTTPVLNADGTQKHQHMDVKLEFESVTEKAGGDTEFKLKVMGQALHPVGHPQAGEPDGSKPVSMSSSLIRTFNKNLPTERVGSEAKTEQTAGVHVHHSMFVLKPAFSGGGLGMEIIKNQMASYHKAGVSDVTVEAAWMGQYVWGRVGFEANPRFKTAVMSDFHKKMTTLQQGANAVLKGPNKPYTAQELADMHDLKEHGTPAVFGLHVPAYNPKTGKMEEKQVWKDYMLKTPPIGQGAFAPPFEGHLPIKPGNANYEQMKEYLKIKDSGAASVPTYRVKKEAAKKEETEKEEEPILTEREKKVGELREAMSAAAPGSPEWQAARTAIRNLPK